MTKSNSLVDQDLRNLLEMLKAKLEANCAITGGDILDQLRALEDEARKLGVETDGKTLRQIKQEVSARRGAQ